jgi:hypothetical protein
MGAQLSPAEARFTYCFAPDFPDELPPPEEMEQLERELRADPYNHNRVWTQQSLCELPLAPSSPFTLVCRPSSAGITRRAGACGSAMRRRIT